MRAAAAPHQPAAERAALAGREHRVELRDTLLAMAGRPAVAVSGGAMTVRNCTLAGHRAAGAVAVRCGAATAQRRRGHGAGGSDEPCRMIRVVHRRFERASRVSRVHTMAPMGPRGCSLCVRAPSGSCHRPSPDHPYEKRYVKPSENKIGIPATKLVENVCMQKLEVWRLEDKLE